MGVCASSPPPPAAAAAAAPTKTVPHSHHHHHDHTTPAAATTSFSFQDFCNSPDDCEPTPSSSLRYENKIDDAYAVCMEPGGSAKMLGVGRFAIVCVGVDKKKTSSLVAVKMVDKQFAKFKSRDVYLEGDLILEAQPHASLLPLLHRYENHAKVFLVTPLAERGDLVRVIEQAAVKASSRVASSLSSSGCGSSCDGCHDEDETKKKKKEEEEESACGSSCDGCHDDEKEEEEDHGHSHSNHGAHGAHGHAAAPTPPAPPARAPPLPPLALTPEWTRRSVMALTSAVLRLHQLGIAHRDIKPDNIYVTAEGGVVLGDFGLAERVGGGAVPSTVAMAVAGSAAYTAPEVLNYHQQQQHNGYDVLATDMWSLGCVAYILLTGQHPFGGCTAPHEDNEEARLRAERAEYSFPDRSLLAAVGSIDALGRDFVSRLLVREPGGRMTAEEAVQHAWLQQPLACVADEESMARCSDLEMPSADEEEEA